MSVIVIPQVTADGSSPNSLAISVVVIDTVKKSNAASSLSIRFCTRLCVLSSKLTIPRPASQANEEQVPLMRIELFQNRPWVLQRLSRRLQRSEPGRKVVQDLLRAVEPAQLHVVSHLYGCETCYRAGSEDSLVTESKQKEIRGTERKQEKIICLLSTSLYSTNCSCSQRGRGGKHRRLNLPHGHSINTKALSSLAW